MYNFARKVIKKLVYIFNIDDTVNRLLYKIEMLEAHTQMVSLQLIKNQYRNSDFALSSLNLYELSVYSQNGEDGILFYIFSKIGTTNRYFVEFGIEDGTETNTRNLSINFGWHGLLIEGNQQYAKLAEQFYVSQLKTHADNVRIANSFVTRENINELFETSGIPPEIDLLSIDIDGNDYWIWDALAVTSPRVIVIEYNASLGDEEAITVVYEPNFNRLEKHPSGYYHGASLLALQKLSVLKGYMLVGCDSKGVNAFFIRKDVGEQHFIELTAKQAYFPHSQRIRVSSTSEQFQEIAHLPFIKV